MKERPILFNTEMVCAILDGRKTHTRRPCKNFGNDNCIKLGKYRNHILDEKSLVKSPFGIAGDQLWVRETFATYFEMNDPSYRYKAAGDKAPRWTPSIHMPRDASRIQLSVKCVWVERVQEIDPVGICSEGVVWDDNGSCDMYKLPSVGWTDDPHVAFAELWDSIYTDEHSWDANPWVWCCEFEVIK